MLKLSENEKIFTISLNRPDVRNAFNSELIEAITEKFIEISVRQDLRAVVLRGEGKVFCAGADLQMMQEMVNYSLQENQRDADALYKMFEAISLCPHPVIAVAHGAAFGGALGLLACADIVICDEKTQLCFSEVKLGIVPAVISGFILKKCTALQISRWMISGRLMRAKDAKKAGLVHEVTDDVGDALKKWIETFLEAGPEAVRATKRLLTELSSKSEGDWRSLTTNCIAERRVSREGQEGLKSFLEKRNPSWRKS